MEVLEVLAPSSLAEPWDNPGLQVGRSEDEVRKMIVSLDPSPACLRRAHEAGAELLLAHHPLLFRPLTRLDVCLFPGQVLAEAVRLGIAIISAHTNLDAAAGGINDILMDILGLARGEPLEGGPRVEGGLQPIPIRVPAGKEDPARRKGTGLGRIGQLDRPIRLAEMARKVREALEAPFVEVLGHGEREIRRVAVVAGSGGSLVSQAHGQGADLLITGDVGYHQAIEADGLGLAVIDCGHFYAEKAALNVFAGRLGDALREKGWAVVVQADREERDPRYPLMGV
jgi:dinuclear metal center YbgI/SA1388 family protein